MNLCLQIRLFFVFLFFFLTLKGAITTVNCIEEHLGNLLDFWLPNTDHVVWMDAYWGSISSCVK